jgi:hypothetical protein
MRLAEVAAACLILLGLFISAVHPLRGNWEGVITADNIELRVGVCEPTNHQVAVWFTGTLKGHPFSFAWSSDRSWLFPKSR